MVESLVNKVLVSVVIPVKNGIDTLPSCLDGLFRQTVKDQMEVIVIDSGSTDGTLELLYAPGKGLAKCRDTHIGRIVHHSPVHGLDGRLLYMGRRVEIRTADLEMDHSFSVGLHPARLFKHPSNSRKRHFFRSARD